MKRHTKLFGAALLSAGWTGMLFAGNVLYTFDHYPPPVDPVFVAGGGICIGTHNSTAAGPGGTNYQTWCSGAALMPDGTGTGTNGFPKTGGYLSISDATNGNNNLVFVFPDIDNGLPIAGFQIDMDMRVGNGSLGRPADGFSISFARSGDPVLVNATNLIVNGFAGGDSLNAALNPAGSTDVENGTKTGLAVVFDAWQGNWLPDTTGAAGPGTSTDREGIAVRLDDRTQVQLNLVNNRNERDCTNLITSIQTALYPGGVVGSGAQTNLNDGTNNAGTPVIGGLSMQTGTNAFFSGANGTCAATYGGTDTSGSFTNLYWEHLLVRLTNTVPTQGAVPVYTLWVNWKGVTVISNVINAFSPAVGRLILAGRTGGNMQNAHVDNLALATIPTTNSYIVKVTGGLNNFSFQISDNGPVTVTNVVQVILTDNQHTNGIDVTAGTLPSISYLAPITSGGYTNPTFFPSFQQETVTLTWLDNLGHTNIGAIPFTVPIYSIFPTNFALPLSAIDTTKPGFLVNAYQTVWNNPNVIAWTDETLEGLHGVNLVTPQQPVVGGFQVWNNVLGFYNYGGKSGNIVTPGLFSTAGSLGLINGVAVGDADFDQLGLGGTSAGNGSTYDNGYRHDYYDNIIMEFFGYIYFPTSGVYSICFGNDDQYQVTVGSSPFDRMGTPISASTAVRVPNANSGNNPVFNFDVQDWYVTQAGCYPIRIVWENGGGGCTFEAYTYNAPGPNTPGFGTFLLNDVANAATANGVVLLGYYGLNGTVDTGPYLWKAMPPRNPPTTTQNYGDMYFYSPIVIDLVDGTTATGPGKAINDSSINLTVDSKPVSFSHSRSGSTVHIAQTGTVAWNSGLHTNNLTFADNNGTNYLYNWIWACVGGNPNGGGVAQLDGTNYYPGLLTNGLTISPNNNVISIPASLAQPASAVDTTKPGLRVRTWQTPMEAGQNHSGWSDGELQGQKGWNVADLSKESAGGYFVWDGLLDFRYDSGGGSGAEWNFDLEDSQDTVINPNAASYFGVGINAANPVISPLMPASPLAPQVPSAGGATSGYHFGYGPNGVIPANLNTKMETSAIEFSGWIVFPSAGPYIMQFNTDDGFRVMWPQGNPTGKLDPAVSLYVTNTLLEANVGRGVANSSGGIYNGGTWGFFNVPQAGAYPIRLLYFNGGTGAGMEVSVVQAIPDGRVSRIPLNAPASPPASPSSIVSSANGAADTYDPNTANAVKIYQTLTSADVNGSIAPYVSHVDPVSDEPDAIRNEPTVVDITDGGGKTINASSVQLISDGYVQNVSVSQASGVTHVVQQMASGFFWLGGGHTNILTYADNSGNHYTNLWRFNAQVPNANIVWVPASMSVPLSAVDTTQPGFRVKSYQAPAGGGVLGTVNSAEQVLNGLYGPNLITTTPVAGYWVWSNAVDFCDNTPINSGHGEFRYNYSFTNSLGAVLNPGLVATDGQVNNLVCVFAGWFEFTQPGMYAMTVNSDDGFKVSVPFGQNPFNEQGFNLNWVSAGRGDSGGSSNPFNGSATPVFFNIPQAGAYPIRLLYYNGGGGLAVEWTLFQPQPDGSVERVLIGDFASYPNQVKVYQTLTTNPPTVLSSFSGSYTNSAQTNSPGLVFGAQPQLLLGSELGFGAQTSSQLPITGDYWLKLQDGSVAINPGTVTLSLNGVQQPITVTNGGGVTTVFRFATNGLWPSGAWAPIMVSFQDVNGASYTYPVEWVMTPFWGTLHHGYPTNWADPNSPGFKVRTVQNDPAYTSSGVLVQTATTGPQVTAQRVHVEEQLLTGLWGPNFAMLGPTNYGSYAPGGPTYGGFNDLGYFDLNGIGPTNGVINLNAQYPAQAGDFQYSTSYQYFNQPIPGLQGTGPSTVNGARNNSAACEFLAYVAFPTNGTYTLGISSDDGFRVMQQWTPPANIGSVVINSPVGIARRIPAAMNITEGTANPSCPVTNNITGNLVLATGAIGASTNGEGCVINNGSALAGNIALLLQSKNGGCSINQQVVNAAAAGARAVVLITIHRALTDGGQFPDEFQISPMQPIPLVSIEESDGTNIVAALQLGPVNVTLTPEDYQFNPPDDRVLGQTSVGKGNSDCNFSVVVTNAPGLYPIRITYINGGGGVNLDMYSLTGNGAVNGGRVLINDRNTANGIALQAFYKLLPPSISIVGGNLQVTYVGTLLTSTDPTLPIGSWTTVSSPSPVTIPISSSQPHQYFRAVYAQRP